MTTINNQDACIMPQIVMTSVLTTHFNSKTKAITVDHTTGVPCMRGITTDTVVSYTVVMLMTQNNAHIITKSLM